MKKVLALLVCIAVSGCTWAWEKKIGTNRYQINAMGGLGFSNADDNFIQKAKELCPGGFKVLERYVSPEGMLYGTIECE